MPAGMPTLPPRLARVLRLLGRILFVPIYLWCVGALWYGGPVWLGSVFALSFAVAWPALWYGRPADRRRTAGAFALSALLLVVGWQFKRPSNDRQWTPDMARPARIEIDGDRVAIGDIRDCAYRTEDEYDLRYVDQEYDLQALRSVDFLLERFHALDFLAHTLLSFGFEDGRHVAISVELRREEGETFHPVAGLFKQYEIMYVVGTEQDLIGLRTNHRKSRVWLYPIKTTPERMRALFVHMLERARAIAAQPEFYNTLTSSCTTNIVDHVRLLVPGRIPLDWRILFPGYTGEMAYELGLIDTEGSFDEAAARFRIDPAAQAAPVGPDFSRRIRAGR